MYKSLVVKLSGKKHKQVPRSLNEHCKSLFNVFLREKTAFTIGASLININ